MICVSASIMLADGTGDVPLKGVCMVVLVLGWFVSRLFWNRSPLLVGLSVVIVFLLVVLSLAVVVVSL